MSTLRTPVRHLLLLGALCCTTLLPGRYAVAQNDDDGTRFPLAYEGAFRVPEGPTDETSFDFGGTALMFDADRRSLWLVGHDHHQRVAEISIPDIRSVDTIGELDTARLLTPFRDLLQGRRSQVGSNDSKIGGLLRIADEWIVSAWVYYDAAGEQSRSHFRVRTDGTVIGPVQIGPDERDAGFVSGYMAPIPPEYRNRLGGRAFTGQCCIPIISRTSQGPALSAFDPEDIGVRTPVPRTDLLGYPMEFPTLGTWEEGEPTLYNGNTKVAGVVLPEGTRSVLFFGRVGLGEFCYGVGTSERSQHGRPVPGSADDRYCYDPDDPEKGSHGYPYAAQVWAYDAEDLIAVARDQRRPWDVHPYAARTFSLPFDRGLMTVGGVAYDPAERRIFLSALLQDDFRPIIHVFRLGELGEPPAGTPNGGIFPSPDRPAPRRPTSKPPVGRAVPR